MVYDQSPQPGQGESTHLVPAEIRDVSFPVALRGYDRHAVDEYVRRVNRVIAELEIGRSPQAAVRHALDRVAEQVGGILQRARETAEEISASAQQEADEHTARAKAEAATLVVNSSAEADRTKADADEFLAKARAEANETLAHTRAAAEKTLAQARADADEHLQQAEEAVAAVREQAQARMRELHADTDAAWEERRELLDDIRGTAARLEEVAGAAAARFPPREPAEHAEEELPEVDAGAGAEPTAVAGTDEPTGAMPAIASRDGEDHEPADEEPK